MSTPDNPVDDTATLHYDVDSEEEWLQAPDELPPRPRRKLLAPVPVALLAALLVGAGFLAGVEVQKGQTRSTPEGAGFAGLAASRGGTGSGTSSGAGRGL